MGGIFGGGGGSATPVPVVTTAVSDSADDTSEEVKAARDKTRKQALAAQGRSSTLLTSDMDESVSTSKKTLLGQ